MTLTQKLIQNLSKNKNVQSFLSDFAKLSKDLKEKSQELNKMWTSEKNKTIDQAHTQYQKVAKSISQTQAELDREVNKAISLIIKSADDVEKNLTAYKKKVLAQKSKIEKMILSSQKTAKKASKASSPRTSAKKTTKKAVAKTTRKVMTKKATKKA